MLPPVLKKRPMDHDAIERDNLKKHVFWIQWQAGIQEELTAS
jgi:hypothetical protein